MSHITEIQTVEPLVDDIESVFRLDRAAIYKKAGGIEITDVEIQGQMYLSFLLFP